MEFRVLGPLTVADGDASLQVGGPKQRTVLAMLIAHAGRPLTAETIALAVYGLDVDDGGKRRVQTYISTLRSIIGDVIVKVGPGWLLDVDRADIDAAWFEELYEAARSAESLKASELLREALGVWRGEPYSGIEAHGALDGEITRLVELRIAAEHARISADLNLGRDADLIGDIEGLMAEHPYQERFRAQHMLALYRAGRQTEALRSFQEMRSVLTDELGVDPSLELQELETRILNHDHSLLLESRSDDPPQPPDTPKLEIRFAVTDDGVGIAYWEHGSGPPLIFTQNLLFNHLEAEWDVPSMASLYTELADRYRLVRLNHRGFGLSENPFPRFGTTPSGAQAGMTVSDLGLDIAAVASACGLDRFILMAFQSMGPIAIDYAAEHPYQVTGMVLCETVAAIQSSYVAEAMRAQALLGHLSPDLGIPVAPWGEGTVPMSEMLHIAELVSLAVGQVPDGQAAIRIAVAEWDSSSRMSEVVAPTTILTTRHPESEHTTPDAQRLAIGIPSARLMVIDGIMAPYNADRTAVLDAIDAIHPTTP
jgi:DNA-binding SARP family transcriptional activator/pimeloyl-ACP methyl ester carboxylesterase